MRWKSLHPSTVSASWSLHPCGWPASAHSKRDLSLYMKGHLPRPTGCLLQGPSIHSCNVKTIQCAQSLQNLGIRSFHCHTQSFPGRPAGFLMQTQAWFWCVHPPHHSLDLLGLLPYHCHAPPHPPDRNLCFKDPQLFLVNSQHKESEYTPFFYMSRAHCSALPI